MNLLLLGVLGGSGINAARVASLVEAPAVSGDSSESGVDSAEDGLDLGALRGHEVLEIFLLVKVSQVGVSGFRERFQLVELHKIVLGVHAVQLSKILLEVKHHRAGHVARLQVSASVQI